MFNCDSLAHMLAERPLYSYLNFEDLLFKDMVQGSGMWEDGDLAPEELWKDNEDYYFVRTGRDEPEDDFRMMRRWTNLLHADHLAYYRQIMRDELQKTKAYSRRLKLEKELLSGKTVSSAEYMRCVRDAQPELQVGGDTTGEMQLSETEGPVLVAGAGGIRTMPSPAGGVGGGHPFPVAKGNASESSPGTSTSTTGEVNLNAQEPENVNGQNFYYNERGERMLLAPLGSCQSDGADSFIWHRDGAADDKDAVSADWRLEFRKVHHSAEAASLSLKRILVAQWCILDLSKEFVQHVKRLTPLAAWTNLQCPNMMELLAQDLEMAARKTRLSPTDPRMRDDAVTTKQIGADAHLALLTDGVCWNVVEAIMLVLAKKLPYIFLGHGLYEYVREKGLRRLDEGSLWENMEKVVGKILGLTRLLQEGQYAGMRKEQRERVLMRMEVSSEGNGGRLPVPQTTATRGLSPLLLKSVFATLAFAAKRKRLQKFRRCLLASILDVDLGKVEAKEEHRRRMEWDAEYLQKVAVDGEMKKSESDAGAAAGESESFAKADGATFGGSGELLVAEQNPDQSHQKPKAKLKPPRPKSRNFRRYKTANFAAWESKSMMGQYEEEDPSASSYTRSFAAAPTEVVRWADFVDAPEWSRTEHYPENVKANLRKARFVTYESCGGGGKGEIANAAARQSSARQRLRKDWAAYVSRQPIGDEWSLEEVHSSLQRFFSAKVVGRDPEQIRNAVDAAMDPAVGDPLVVPGVNRNEAIVNLEVSTSSSSEGLADTAGAVHDVAFFLRYLHETLTATTRKAPSTPTADQTTPEAVVLRLFEAFIGSAGVALADYAQFAANVTDLRAKFTHLMDTPFFPWLDGLLRADRLENAKIPSRNFTVPYRWDAARTWTPLPVFYVMPERDLIADHVRKLNQVDCPVQVMELLQNATVDYFFEIGGYFGDCSAAAAWLGLAERGVFNVDGSDAAVDALKKTFAAWAEEGWMEQRPGLAVGAAAREEINAQLERGGGTSKMSLFPYVLHTEAHFVSDKDGRFRRTDADGLQTNGPNALTAATWESCGDKEDNTHQASCTSFVTVATLLQRFFNSEMVVNAEQVAAAASNRRFASGAGGENSEEQQEEAPSPPSVGIRMKVSGNDDEVIRGMVASLEEASLFRVRWLHLHIVPWCTIRRRIDCIEEIKNTVTEKGFEIVAESRGRAQYYAAKTADIIAVRE
eukprot:g11756.t1